MLEATQQFESQNRLDDPVPGCLHETEDLGVSDWPLSSWHGLGAGGEPGSGQPHLRLCWLSRCRRRSTLRWKPLAHSSQLKGLKPVCFRLWVMRLELWLKAFPHTWHLCGFSPAAAETGSGSPGPGALHLLSGT